MRKCIKMNNIHIFLSRFKVNDNETNDKNNNNKIIQNNYKTIFTCLRCDSMKENASQICTVLYHHSTIFSKLVHTRYV